MIVARSRGARAPYILVLEDLDDIANLLRDELSGRGYRGFSLRSKSAAERFLKRVRPDLVIVDYELLGGSGLMAAQMAAEADVPVVVISGYDVRECGSAWNKGSDSLSMQRGLTPRREGGRGAGQALLGHTSGVLQA